ncbi:hypothetical protein POTOM_034988 [Populus tomentosa]|uniref:Uncharacterized protein n=1 Tax=Populus tomentosa TaxID=118781 RepID=A0A8X7ZED1_POPTO|nr:hypothetical protein POTOM_034988 [Populus tomentosa]
MLRTCSLREDDKVSIIFSIANKFLQFLPLDSEMACKISRLLKHGGKTYHAVIHTSPGKPCRQNIQGNSMFKTVAVGAILAIGYV